ncbi:MAG: hypothetical protein JWL81_882 [Verrucomicrobiales bacterium]|nr:hypothetical protein [Verrucomicrobiales bacterium]
MFTFPRFFPVIVLVLPLLVQGGPRALAQNGVINEFHYDEDDPTVHSEYVELHNPGGAGGGFVRVLFQ